MPGPKPSARPRPGGGFSPGVGGLNEHLDENAMQVAMQQKALGQQASSSSGGPAGQKGGGGDISQLMKQMGAGGQGKKQAGGLGKGLDLGQGEDKAPPSGKKPREVGTLKDELVKRPLQDIAEGLKSFFDINTLLGINPTQDSPEEQMKKKQLHARWQKLDKEQQAVAQKNYQEKMEKKKQEEEEKELKKQQEEQQKAQTIEMPSSPKKGPVGPAGSKKQKATQQLEQSRKGLGKVGNKN